MKRTLLISLMIISAVFGQTVDYESDIQPIFNNKCISCHGNSGGLDLSSGVSFANLVDVAAAGYGSAFRVVSADTTNSVLHAKITNTGAFGGIMPPTSTGNPLTQAEIITISSWITELVPNVTIAEARALDKGDIVTIEGIVTSPNFSLSNEYTEHTIQDESGALTLFDFSLYTTPLQIGDAVRATGELDSYNGKFELIADGADVTILSSGNTLPDFQELTLAELLLDPESYEAELVRVDSARIVSGTWPGSGSGSQNLTITDPSGAQLTMRIDSDTDIGGTDQMLGWFVLQGIVGQFDYDNLWSGGDGYQIFPRAYSDFTPIGDPTPLISNVVQAPAGPTPADEVTVFANIIDNGSVASASINYVVNSGTEMVVAMPLQSGNSYAGIIPAQAGGALVEYTISATDNFGGVGTSDVFSYVVYDGTVTSIASIQDGTVAEDSIVTIQGIVTAEPYAFYPEDDLHYYFIQDDMAMYSGIKVFDSGRALAEGDEVRLTGKVTEYYDMTEIIDVSALEVLSTGHNVVPTAINLGIDLEQWEGCLIQISNVTVSDPDMGYGEWSVTDGTNSIVIDDAADYFYTPVADEALASIVGVLDYSFGAYKLQPRLTRDIQTADGLTSIQAIQQVRYSDLLPHYDEVTGDLYFQDTSYFHAEWTDSLIVTVEGVVTMPTGLSFAGDGVKFIFQDINGGPWSSILCYDPDNLTFPTLREGFVIQATGYISEFTTPGTDGAAAMTELFITEDIQVVRINEPLPEEPVVKTGDLRWPPTAEQWGNVVVKVENAKIIQNNPTGFDILAIDDGSGIVYIDDDSDSLANYIQPPAGSKFDLVRGWVYHHYGSYDDSTTYKLVPLYKSDLILNTVSTDDALVPQHYALSNYPNPFNPTTNIRFQIPETGVVRLAVFNQLGQHVVTLVDKNLHSGEYEITWHGRDAQGRQVSSGLYFYRMTAGDQQLVGKMTYLK